MRIDIVWGKSEGKTLLSAFDRALVKAGIHNFNLIPLSSVIPPKSVIHETGTYKSSRGIGEIMYVVISSLSSHKSNALISAGLGWVRTQEGGLLIESKGEFSREECEGEIRVGLTEMMDARGWSGQIKLKVITHKVREMANVTVAAVYNFK